MTGPDHLLNATGYSFQTARALVKMRNEVRDCAAGRRCAEPASLSLLALGGFSASTLEQLRLSLVSLSVQEAFPDVKDEAELRREVLELRRRDQVRELEMSRLRAEIARQQEETARQQAGMARQQARMAALEASIAATKPLKSLRF